MWHSAHVALGMRCISCTRGVCCRLDVDLSSLNLGSGSFKTVNVVSKLGFGMCREIQLENEGISVLEVTPEDRGV